MKISKDLKRKMLLTFPEVHNCGTPNNPKFKFAVY